jgi:hypothetical protein
MEDIKRTQVKFLEVTNVISEIKNTLDGINRLDNAKEKSSTFGDRNRSHQK